MIILPFPDSKLMPNRKNGRHWAVYQKAKEQARSEAYYLTLESKEKPYKSLKITFYTPDKRKRDTDNLYSAMKHSIDGMSKAWGIDDSEFEKVLLIKKVAEKKDKARVEVEALV